ncbi:hypothetical protein SLEP1_g50017 [Rubroshorea leprosula]|uniref:Uncharacterized protein n=1 Tax=Rubroshorea leprosula TaxID=152421 RepID=A0AAV5LYM1_9ROSI|nr:hypothetical protein SLEP1_g50017 [Rubroshorea leprosula]
MVGDLGSDTGGGRSTAVRGGEKSGSWRTIDRGRGCGAS